MRLQGDADDAEEELKKDVITLNDSTFNEVLRALGGEIGRSLAEKTNALDKYAAVLNLTMVKPEEGRFE